MAIKVPPVVDPIIRAMTSIWNSVDQIAAQKGSSEAGKVLVGYSKGGKRLLNEYMGIPTSPEATVSTVSMFAKQAADVRRTAQETTQKDGKNEGPDSQSTTNTGPK